MIVTFEQAHAYFSKRLGEPRLPARGSITHRCPFHNDRTASLSVNLDKGGIWKCHACNIGGGLYEFESQMFGTIRTTDELWAEIHKITGIVPAQRNGGRELGKVVATYQYTDADGKLLFEKRRHEPKTFTQRAPKDRGWVYSLQDVRKVLFNLPSVTVSQIVMICEGEKDCLNLAAALGDKLELQPGKFAPIAFTCNFDGAGKWRDDYSACLANRHVVIFPDNDEPGRAHALQVARSVVKYATSVKIVELPGLPEKGDVSDFLELHSAAELLAEVTKTARYKAEEEPKQPAAPFFVPPADIIPPGTPALEWIVPGIIHRGAKGMIVASPKAGKSMISLDLAIALASGQDWLGFSIPQPVRTAVMSREDGAAMTSHRLQQFARGRGLDFSDLPLLHVNTFQQRRQFAIDNDEDLDSLIAAVKADEIAFLIIDVMNRVMSPESENDNARMTAMMARFDRVRIEAGCDVAVIHHDAKNSAPGPRKPRGASSIDSWWDWKLNIDVDPSNDSLKHIHFGTKASSPHPSIEAVFQTHLSMGNKIVRVN